MKSSFVIIILLFAVYPILAQPGDPSTDPDNAVPITGIELLLGAGALWGAKRIYNRNRENNKISN